MKITKTITYDIHDCGKWGMSIDDTVKHRKRAEIKTDIKDKCFVCGHEFKSSDFPNLAIIRNHTNEFVCDKCASEIKESIKNDEKAGEENDRNLKTCSGKIRQNPWLRFLLSTLQGISMLEKRKMYKMRWRN